MTPSKSQTACYKCTRRKLPTPEDPTTCHSTCDEYKEFQRICKEQNEKEGKAKRLDAIVKNKAGTRRKAAR